MSKKVKITINPLGDPTIDLEGYEGKSCLERTRHLEDALGGQKEVSLKPEADTATSLQDNLNLNVG